MKKTIFILSLVTLLTLLGIGLAVTASAEEELPTSGKLGADVYWSLDVATGELTISGSGDMDKDVYVAPLYLVKDLIKKAYIENGITSIGMFAFVECYNLTEVSIPESVTYIGVSAFSECSGLTEINIPESVTVIGNGAFYGCSGLTEIDIPKSVTYIDAGAFSECSGLTEINVPESVTYIGNGAFCGCSGLTKINIPESVTFIGSSAFRYTNIETITLGTGIKEIGSYTFQSCYNLKSVNILGEITSIGAWAFEYCTSLESITIPSSLTYIGMDSFDSCTSLKSMYISDLVSWLKVDLNYAASTPLSNGADLYLKGQLVTDLVIPSIPYAYELGKHFSGCTSIRSVVIPDNIECMSGSFKNCVNLTSVTIPNSVKGLGTNTFENCTALTSITLPDSIKKVGMDTFKNCTCLKEVRFPVGTSEISSDAFNGCTALTTLYIPSTITKIWYGAFENCTALKNIVYCGTADSWEQIEKYDGWNKNTGDFSVIYHDYKLESVDEQTHKKRCVFCGDEAVYDHILSAWKMHNKDQHKSVCECGYARYTEHSWDNGQTLTQPTHTSEGSIKFICADCSGTKTEPILKLPEHTYSQWQKHDDTKHKKVCECTDTQYADHTYGEWSITKEAAEGTEGERERLCICGYKQTEVIPAIKIPSTEILPDTDTTTSTNETNNTANTSTTHPSDQKPQDSSALDETKSGCGSTASFGVICLITASMCALVHKKKKYDN